MGMQTTLVAVGVCALVAAGCAGDDSGDGSADPVRGAGPEVAADDTDTSTRSGRRHDLPAGQALSESSDVQVPPLPVAPDQPVDPDRPGPTEPAPVAPAATVSGFFDTATDRLSTFAMDVDTASYTHARSWIEAGQLPAASTVRPEEFVNYFHYGYPAPTGDDAWGVHVDGGPAPWQPTNQLVRVGLNTPELAADQRPDATLTFVVDVSGSMDGQPIETVKHTLTLLASRLRATDRIGIVTYGDVATVVLPPTPLSESDSVTEAVAALTTGGATYAEDGLRVGYEQARANMTPNGINTVVLASDGVANVGATGPDAILGTIRDGVDAGISLLALGVGGNDGYNDHLMETLTNTGNGTAYYVHGRDEAERLFVDRLESTLTVVASDSKVQVEFDPSTVARWRLIGYDNRDLADDDFRDDTVDAGEVGAGHEVTAIYEVELAGAGPDDLGAVHVRWAHPGSGAVSEVRTPITLDHVTGTAGPGFGTAVAAAALAEVLRGSPHVGGWTLADVAGLGGGLLDGLDDLLTRAETAHPAP